MTFEAIKRTVDEWCGPGVTVTVETPIVDVTDNDTFRRYAPSGLMAVVVVGKASEVREYVKAIEAVSAKARG